MRKGAWVSTLGLHRQIGIEKAIKELKDMGIEEVYIIVVNSGGALYPSKVRPSLPQVGGKDLITPLVKEARKADLRVHAWIVSLNFHQEDFMKRNKYLYVVNKLGISCIEKPPYVDHYKWLCPSRPQVRENLVDTFLEIAERFDVDGLHFDYIRLPDIILPKGIRGRYPGVPKEEVLKPEFDYCYCNVCRSLFKEEKGLDPIAIPYDDPNYQIWFKWRADRITDIVRYVCKKVKLYDSSLEVSAAVFATPSLAYRYVFQDWPNWGLDLYNPMIYHKYYEKPVEWIGEAVKEGVRSGARISAGILIGFMESFEELYRGFKLALENGAVGITVFVYPPPRSELKDWVKKAFKELAKDTAS
ncbi:MAG: Tat pathway signal protein [Thermoprotei archaeon]|nr:MAG: Tat pathway signal protein [Thermoprotei archaeon]